MRLIPLLLTLATPAMAGTLGEVTGNWAGPQNTGFYFRAVLSDDNGKARLQIWNAADAVPTGRSLTPRASSFVTIWCCPVNSGWPC
jgi:hypothetical protein